MSSLILLVKKAVLWLERRFPAKITQEDAQRMLDKVNESMLKVLESEALLRAEVNQMKSDITKVKIAMNVQDLRVG